MDYGSMAISALNISIRAVALTNAVRTKFPDASKTGLRGVLPQKGSFYDTRVRERERESMIKHLAFK